MKKIFQYLFLAVIVFSFVSCSSDSDTETPVLLRKLTSVNMGQNAAYTFSYKGTQLTKVAFEIEAVADGSGYDLYTYNGNLIAEVKRFNAANQNTATTTFTYNSNNQLTQAVKVQPANNYGFKSVFTYNVDGSVTVTGFSGTTAAQTTPSTTVEKFYFHNGEVTQKEFVSNTTNFSVAYTYDNANHPMQNVTGINAIKLYSFIADGLFGMQHNVTKQITTVSGESPTEIAMDADYNTSNYPVALYSADGLYQHQFTYFK
jgi:hypothetical protein